MILKINLLFDHYISFLLVKFIFLNETFEGTKTETNYSQVYLNNIDIDKVVNK